MLKKGGIIVILLVVLNFPIRAAAPRLFSVGSTSNGVIQICLTPSIDASQAVVVDTFQKKYTFFRQHQLWTAVVPVVDYMPGTYQFIVNLDGQVGSPSQSISVNITEGGDTWNQNQKEIRDLVFDIHLLLQTRLKSVTHLSATESMRDEMEAVQVGQNKLIRSLAANRDAYLLVNQNRTVLDNDIEPLYAQLRGVESRLNNTRDALTQKMKLVALLTSTPNKTRRASAKRDVNAIRAAYVRYFSKRHSFTTVETETIITAIKIESAQLYQKKLGELAERDALLETISDRLLLYPKLAPPPSYSSAAVANRIEIANRYEWTSPDGIRRRLLETKQLLTDTASHPFPEDIERRMLQILDLKNGRADFLDIWGSTDWAQSGEPEGDVDRIDAQLAAAMSALRHRLAEQSLVELAFQSQKVDQKLKAQNEQSNTLKTLLDELNEAVKKKYRSASSLNNPIDPLIKDDPNVYDFLGAIDLATLRSSDVTKTDVAIIVRPTEPVTGRVQVLYNNQSTRLSPISPGLWVGIIPNWTNTATIDLKITQNQRQFFKRYSGQLQSTSALQHMSDLTHLSLADNGRRKVASFDVPYQPVNYATQHAFGALQWVPPVSSNLSIRGIKTISIRNKFLRGQKDGFTPGTQRDELLRITATGTINDIEVSATIQDSTTVLNDSNPNSIELKQANWGLFFGEYWANMNQTELMAYNKRLDGVKGWIRHGEFELTGMVSESKGQPGYDQVFGTNSQGPYTTTHRPIILYSETVIFRGNQMIRDTDYAIDYELGEIRFLKSVVPDSELFTIAYEYADTAFKRTFVAGYLGFTPTASQRLHSDFELSHLGLSWQTLSENGDVLISGNQTLAPQSQYALGIDTTFQYQNWLTGYSELAGSAMAQPTGSGVSSNRGFGIKQGLEIKTDTLLLNGSIKSLSPDFRPLGNAYLNPGMVAYAGTAAYQPGPDFKAMVGYGHDSYPKNNGTISAVYIDTLTDYGPWSYRYYTRVDRDTSSTQNLTEKTVERNTGQLALQLGSISIRPGVKYETLSSPSSPSSSYRASAFNVDSRYQVSDEVQLGSSVELRQQRDDFGNQTNRNQLGSTALVTLGSDNSVDGTVSTVHDTEQGHSGLAVINYALRPQKNVKLNGGYTLETIQEKIGTASYRVMNQQGNFQFTVRPTPQLGLNYKFKPTISELLDTAIQIEQRVIHQYGLTTDLSDTWRVGLDYKTTDKTLRDKYKTPQNVVTQAGNDRIFLVQSDIQLDTNQNLRYALEANTAESQSLQSGSDPGYYDTGITETTLHNVEYLNQINPTIRLSGAYRGGRTIIEQRTTPSSNVHLQSNTIEGSTEWNPDASFNLKFTGSGTQTIDINRMLPDTYLVSGRVDNRTKLGTSWTLNQFVEITQSFAGQTTFRKRASVNIRHDTRLLSLLTLILSAQVDYEGESAPQDYDTFDTLLKFTATL